MKTAKSGAIIHKPVPAFFTHDSVFRLSSSYLALRIRERGLTIMKTPNKNRKTAYI
ncbi:MAG: hypothetical protein LBR26_05185 [Prevotella sp.]|jgi:hypothetical protein|nr:hypothetical protein [Prevotella sp.]